MAAYVNFAIWQPSCNNAAANPEKTAALRATLMHYVESGASRPGAQGSPGSLDALSQERDHRNRMLEARFGTGIRVRR